MIWIFLHAACCYKLLYLAATSEEHFCPVLVRPLLRPPQRQLHCRHLGPKPVVGQGGQVLQNVIIPAFLRPSATFGRMMALILVILKPFIEAILWCAILCLLWYSAWLWSQADNKLCFLRPDLHLSWLVRRCGCGVIMPLSRTILPSYEQPDQNFYDPGPPSHHCDHSGKDVNDISRNTIMKTFAEKWRRLCLKICP